MLAFVLFLFLSVSVPDRDASELCCARAPRPVRAQTRAFASLCAVAEARLVEVRPAAVGDEAAAFGFSLAWALAGPSEQLIFWVAPDHGLAESGMPHAEGFAQFGLDLERLLLVRTRAQADALWAAEQALTAPGACVLCVIAPAPKPLGLTATRRLLLTAEKHNSRCILLRLDTAGASAAWMRWDIAAAPSQGAGRELGAPSFHARLTRNRAGPTGQSWRLEWNAHEHAFHAAEAALDGDLAAALADRWAPARAQCAA
jgi:protein ImuA